MENYAKNGRENNKFIGDYVDANAAQREHSNIKRYTLTFSNIQINFFLLRNSIIFDNQRKKKKKT